MFKKDPPWSECVTLGQFAELVGLTDQAFYNLRNTYPDTFPEPLGFVGKAAVYWSAELEVFHRQHGYGYGDDALKIGSTTKRRKARR